MNPTTPAGFLILFTLLWGYAMLAPLFRKPGRASSPTTDDHRGRNTEA